MSNPTQSAPLIGFYNSTRSSINFAARGSIVAKTSKIATAIVFIVVGFGAISTSSCEIDDNYCPPGYCEPAAFSSCEELTISECETEPGCSVGLGCACAGATAEDPNPDGCDAIECSNSTSEESCHRYPGCEWTDACETNVSCYGMNEKECNRYSTPCEFLTDPC